MAAISFRPIVATDNPNNSVLTLSYDDIRVDGNTAYLVNPVVTLYTTPGYSDKNNSMTAEGDTVGNGQFHSGTISGGTRSWGMSSQVITLSNTESTHYFNVRMKGLSFFVGDTGNNVFTWAIQFPRYVPPVQPDPGVPPPPPPLQSIGNIRDKRILVSIPSGRRNARIWVPSNGKPVRVYFRGTRGSVELYEHFPMSRRREIIVRGIDTPGRWDNGEISGVYSLSASFSSIVMNQASLTSGTMLLVSGGSNGYIELMFIYED